MEVLQLASNKLTGNYDDDDDDHDDHDDDHDDDDHDDHDHDDHDEWKIPWRTYDRSGAVNKAAAQPPNSSKHGFFSARV